MTIAMLVAGCTMAPAYKRPDSPVPAQWPAGAAYRETKPEAAAQAASIAKWKEFIVDKRMQQVIELALKNSRDLRIAVLNVERAAASYGIQRASLLPAVNLAGSMNKTLVPADLSTSGTAMTTSQYTVGLGVAAWEIDFFGRIRSLKDQALEQYLATDQAAQNTQILLVSAVANAYLTLAADREALQLASSTLEAQETTFKLTQKRFDAGVASDLDVQRTQSQAEAARVDVARYTQVIALDENALTLLVGAPVPNELLPADLGSVSHSKEVSPGLSSEILLSRPDVLAAEHQLMAANANIGAARAAFFPRITLTGSIGTTSADLSALFKSAQNTWNFAPQIVMPIFDARTWYAYDVTKIEKEIAVAQYEKAVQTAFREVADALAVQGTINRQISAQQSLVNAQMSVYRLSEARYNKGIDSYLSVLDAQRSVYGARQGLITLRLVRHNNLITLYKVLGGGMTMNSQSDKVSSGRSTGPGMMESLMGGKYRDLIT